MTNTRTKPLSLVRACDILDEQIRQLLIIQSLAHMGYAHADDERDRQRLVARCDRVAATPAHDAQRDAPGRAT